MRAALSLCLTLVSSAATAAGTTVSLAFDGAYLDVAPVQHDVVVPWISRNILRQ